MEKKIVSSWFNGKSLPKNYIIPPEKRPGDIIIPACQIPVIDLSMANGVADQTIIVEQIMQAAKKFGFFQVINHGVGKDVINDAMEVFNEFFELPYEEKSHLYSEEINVKEVVEKYCREVKEVGMKILDLICEGLLLESGYFAKGYSEESFLAVNHYPPCPEPRLTLGLPKHCDPNIITLLHQENVPGLQVCVDDNWLLVQPCPGAFVVNMGYQMQIISNGRLKSAEHRVVTNAEKARTTAAFFILPSKDCVIQPAKALVNIGDPPLFKQFQYAEFVETFKAHTNREPEDVLEYYKTDCK
ncbi:Protein DOWNY MILDEW RESISTANCE 6 [Bienertia sinuspersici]